MKTKSEVQEEIDSLRKEWESFFLNTKDKGANKARKRIELLTSVLVYLESSPSPEFIQKERNRLAKKLCDIRHGYDDYLKNIDSQATLSGYTSKMGGKVIKDQQKVLSYLMS